jgi:hypothetical protein
VPASSPSDKIESAIDANDDAGNPPRERHHQMSAGETELHDVDELTEGTF